jgi:hypothetical protein
MAMRIGKLPDALIIGAQKAGTSSLFAWLSQHPRVCASDVKEVHYFDLHFDKPEAWYRAHFRAGPKPGLALEASPYYLFHPLAPARAHRQVPEARLIVLLRDPVDRAFSHHQHNVALGIDPLSFAAALEREGERLGSSEQDLLTGRCSHSDAHQHYSYAARGRYADQIERWLTFFPIDQFLFLDFHELCSSPAISLARVCEFLGLPQLQASDLRAQNSRDYPDLDPDLREQLRATFAEPNARLKRLAGIGF